MLIAIILLLFVSFFFSGSETALTAANKMKLQTKANQQDKKAQKLLELVSKPSEFITSILIGNNIANILLPTLVTTLAIEYGTNIALASALLTVVVIIFAEVLPKTLAATFPDKIAYLVFPIIRVVVLVLKPITYVLNKLTGLITRALSKGEQNSTMLSKDDFRAMIAIAGTEGTFKQEESYRIKGVLDFYNLNVKDVLNTPRIEVFGLPLTATYEEVREIVLKNPFTRYPVYKESIDQIVGVFHSKFLIAWSSNPNQPLEAFMDKSPLMVYEFHSIEQVFRQMTKEKKHMAVVLDEYGGTEGILTHEDVIEAMIGLEIEDETDLAQDALVEKITQTEIICDGKITLHRLNSIFNTDIPEEEDVLAGYLLSEFSYFPKKGDKLERGSLTFKILELNHRAIKKVQIIK